MTAQEVFDIIYIGFLYLFMITTFLSMGMSYTVAQMENGDVPYALGSMFLLAILSIATIPISAPLLLPGDFSLSPLVILRTLILFELIPLTIGLGLRAHYSDPAESWQPSVSQMSTISLMVVIALMVVSQLSAVISLLGSFALLIAILLVGSSLIMGYFMSGPATETRRVTATTAGRAQQRRRSSAGCPAGTTGDCGGSRLCSIGSGRWRVGCRRVGQSQQEEGRRRRKSEIRRLAEIG